MKKIRLIISILATIAAISGVTKFFVDSSSTKDNLQQNADFNVEKLEIPLNEKTSEYEETVEHLGYTTCYNTKLLIPTWIAYKLTDEEVTGTCKRGDNFLPDPDIRGRCANTNDYKKSGYDRGHLAPAADMKWSEQAMDESFYMSNICPQNHNLNAGDWKDLEEQVRDWAIKNGNIYISAGPIVNKKHKTIGENKVAVPNAFYKVLLMNKNGSWRTIGFVFENKAGSKSLDHYAKSVNEIEKITKIDFFHNLPDDIEEKIENNNSIEKFEN